MRPPWLDDNTERIPIPQAAERFGTTTSMINRWIREKHLEAVRDGDTWYVLIPRDDNSRQESDSQQLTSQDAIATIANLRAEIQFLREEIANRSEELRRKDYIVAALITTIISEGPSWTEQTPPRSRSHSRTGTTAWHQDGPRRPALGTRQR